jgi:drug/metabolite transporter (DMT)-like permease
MGVLILVITAIFLAMQSFSFKKFNVEYMRNLTGYFVFNIILSSILALIFLVAGRGISPLQTHTILLGIIFGVLYNLTVLVFIKTMENGPLSYSSLFSSCSFIVPIIAGLAFWNESISIYQIIGASVMAVSFYLGVNNKSSTQSKVNGKWIIFGALTLLCNGTLGVLQKEHQLITPGKQINEFLIVAFLTSALISCILFSYLNFIKGEKPGFAVNFKVLGLAVFSAIFAAVGNKGVMYLSGNMPGTILFPIVNGGIVILSTIISVLFFRERLNKYELIGLFTGIVSLVLLGKAA